MSNKKHNGKRLQSSKNLTDHWPVVTYVRLPQKKEMWMYKNNSVLKGWRPKTENDEAGFGRIVVESLEEATDLMGDVCIEDIIQELFSRQPKRLNLNHQEKELNGEEVKRTH